jgi:thioredoxin 1
MSQVTTLDPTQFNEIVVNAKGLQLVDFYAEWCGPCKVMDPLMQQLKDELDGKITVVKVDVDSHPDIPARYAVRGMPTMMIFKDGQPEDVIVGAQSYKALRARIDKHL